MGQGPVKAGRGAYTGDAAYAGVTCQYSALDDGCYDVRATENTGVESGDYDAGSGRATKNDVAHDAGVLWFSILQYALGVSAVLVDQHGIND